MDSYRLTTSHLDLALDAYGRLTRLAALDQGWVYLQADADTARPVFMIWTDGSDQAPGMLFCFRERAQG